MASQQRPGILASRCPFNNGFGEIPGYTDTGQQHRHRHQEKPAHLQAQQYDHKNRHGHTDHKTADCPLNGFIGADLRTELMFPEAPATVIGPGIRPGSNRSEHQDPTTSLWQLMKKQEMRPEKADIDHPEEGTAEKMQRLLQPVVMIKDMAGQKQKGKKEATGKSKDWKTTAAEGWQKYKDAKQKTKSDILLRKGHPGIFHPANQENQRHNREKQQKRTRQEQEQPADDKGKTWNQSIHIFSRKQRPEADHQAGTFILECAGHPAWLLIIIQLSADPAKTPFTLLKIGNGLQEGLGPKIRPHHISEINLAV